jgi:hypothetical protein
MKAMKALLACLRSPCPHKQLVITGRLICQQRLLEGHEALASSKQRLANMLAEHCAWVCALVRPREIPGPLQQAVQAMLALRLILTLSFRRQRLLHGCGCPVGTGLGPEPARHQAMHARPDASNCMMLPCCAGADRVPCWCNGYWSSTASLLLDCFRKYPSQNIPHLRRELTAA